MFNENNITPDVEIKNNIIRSKVISINSAQDSKKEKRPAKQEADFTKDVTTEIVEETIKESEPHKSKSIKFPVEIYPAAIRKFINECNKKQKYHKDFVGGGILTAASLAIGNSYKVRTFYENSCIIFMAIVGNKGVCKSHPVKSVIEPLSIRDDKTYAEFELQNKAYRILEKEAAKAGKKSKIDLPDKPLLKKFLLTDYTFQGLIQLLSNNQKGVMVYNDELMQMINNFKRFSTSGEQENWNSNWDGAKISIDRKSYDPIMITKPFINIIGTIQTDRLPELANDKRDVSGFIDRVLFVFPDDLKREYMSEELMDENIIAAYSDIINKLADISYDNNSPDVTVLEPSPEAKAKMKEWNIYNTDLINDDATNSNLRGVYSKLDTYLPRIALILQMLYWAAGEGDNIQISVKAMEGAIKAIEYFRLTAKKVDELLYERHDTGKADLIRTLFIMNEREGTSLPLSKYAETLDVSIQYVSKVIKKFVDDRKFQNRSK